MLARWAPEAALRQKARALLQTLPPRPGQQLYLILDDPKQATRGRAMEAIATLKDLGLDASMWAHHDVCAILVYRDHVIPFGIRLYVKPEHSKALGCPFQKTTA